MAYRDRTTSEKADVFDYSVLEVRCRKKGAAAGTMDEVQLLMVDNHRETLGYIRDNIEECIGNIVRLKRMEQPEARGVNLGAALLEGSLEPLVSSLALVNRHGVMGKLSVSLKKVLLLMVMERYRSNRAMACRILGVTREELEFELKLCGVTR